MSSSKIPTLLNNLEASYDTQVCLIGVRSLAKRSGTYALTKAPFSTYSYQMIIKH